MRKTQRGLWETDVRSLDLKQPDVLKWYVERKINIGDWTALDQKTLAAVLPKVKIDPYLRQILEEFIYEVSQPVSVRSSHRRRKK
jgi:hypothetical protein